MKGAFTAAPVLRSYDPCLPIVIEADASDFALGAIVSQTYGDGDHLKKITDAELNYKIYGRELLHRIPYLVSITLIANTL